MGRLSMTRGDSQPFVITPSSDITGKKVYLTAKVDHSAGDDSVFQLSGTVSGPTITLTTQPGDTAGLENKRQELYYDVQLVDGSDIYTMDRGVLEILPEVTLATS